MVKERSSTCVKNLDDIVAGDVLAEEVHAVDDLPPFRASVMDGYAVSKVKCEIYKVVTYKSLAGSDPLNAPSEQIDN